MPLEKLRAALAAKKSVEKSTQPIPLTRAETPENIKLFEMNKLGIFEEIQNHQPLLTYASRKSEKNTRS